MVRAGDRVVADTSNPVVLRGSGFASRWYVPRADVVGEALIPVDLKTFCPYKGIASYHDIDGACHAAWSYRAPFGETAGMRLAVEPGENVAPPGTDRNLSIGEAGALQMTTAAR